MDIDCRAKAIQLLEKIANSVYDRAASQLCFITTEVQVVEEWLKEFLDSHKK